MKKDGQGVLEDHGTKFIGNWIHNKMSGQFVIREANGRERKAKYEHGKFLDWIDYAGGSSRDVKVNSIAPGDESGSDKTKTKDQAKKTGGGFCSRLCGGKK